MNPSGMFIMDTHLGCSRIQHIKIIMIGHLNNFLSYAVVCINISDTISVGNKIECFSHPDRITIIGSVMGYFFNFLCFKIKNPYWRSHTAAVSLPAPKRRINNGSIGNTLTIRCNSTPESCWHWQGFRESTGCCNSP